MSTEESHAILKRVLPLMSQHGVPTTPPNYTVWYDYVCEAHPDLVQELKDRMDRGLDFSPEYCETLYQRYFTEPVQSQVEDIETAMRKAVDAVLGELGEFHEGLGEFAAVLDDTGESLARAPTQEDLTKLVTILVHETRSTRERSSRTETSLQSMAEELTELRAQVDHLTRDSLLDALTEVPNRRAFEDGLKRLTREADESGQPMCLLLADVDYFKRLNDTYGHVVGDQVLRFVAQEIKQCVKGRDLLTRYGGEEFAILLPTTSSKGALMLAESIRAIIEAQVVTLDDGRSIEDLTISIGVAQYQSGEEHSALVARADKCMYQCKAGGRNRVVGEEELAES
ncbi:MAG: GGDEF domain-containing protein [Pseudomonadales bacterium]